MKKSNIKSNIVAISLWAALLSTTSLSSAGAAQAAATGTTVNFVQSASIGDQFEIESSKLALDKSQNDRIKEFAKQLIDDHIKISKDLNDALHMSSALPSLATDTLDPKHQVMLDKLKSLSGTDFDQQYIKAQIEEHSDEVVVFEKYASNGEDALLKKYAESTLPMLKDHQQRSAQLKAK